MRTLSKRAVLAAVALGFFAGQLLEVATAEARPPSEYPLMLRLNGSPTHLATFTPGSDGGNMSIVDAGLGGQVLKFTCSDMYRWSVHTDGGITPSNSEKVGANESRYAVLLDTQFGVSLLSFDGGSISCPVWRMD